MRQETRYNSENSFKSHCVILKKMGLLNNLQDRKSQEKEEEKREGKVLLSYVMEVFERVEG